MAPHLSLWELFLIIAAIAFFVDLIEGGEW